MTYPDVVEEFMGLGMNRINATAAVPYAWFSPATTDPFEPVVIMLTNGLQNALSSMGIQNRGDGWFDSATVDALYRISGPQWKSKAWVQIVGDVRQAKAGGIRKGITPMGYFEALGAFEERNGLCKPSDLPTCNQFSELQNQLNRVLKGLGRKEIRVDGDIGTGTATAVQSVYSLLPAFAQRLSVGSCSAIANNAAALTSGFKAAADGMNVAPRSPAKCRERKVTLPTGLLKTEVTVVKAPSEAGIAAVFTEQPILIGALIGGAFLLWQTMRKKS